MPGLEKLSTERLWRSDGRDRSSGDCGGSSALTTWSTKSGDGLSCMADSDRRGAGVVSSTEPSEE